MELLGAIEKAFVDIAEQSKPAIVGILARKTEDDRSQFGSGFFFRQDGYILTNNHVVAEADTYLVKLLDGTILDAQLTGRDVSSDIAVLKVNREDQFPTLPLADSEQVRVGQFTIAIGNPFQLAYTVTTGIVSGKSRLVFHGSSTVRYQNFIQTDAWIHTGSSGGPLLNIHGEVIGINALIRKIENTPAPVRAGAAFAIPSNLVKSIGTQLIANGKIIRGYIGIRMREIPQGVFISSVGSDTPADRAGLRPRDIIIEYNGKKIQKSHEFMMLIAESQVGKQSIIRVLRRGQEKTLKVIIDEMPREIAGLPVEDKSDSWKMLGLSIRKLEKRDFQRYAYLTDKDRGVIVENVLENAPGFKAKIPRGALIFAVNGKETPTVQTLEALLQANKDKSRLILDIKSSHGIEKITVQLQNKPQ